MLLLMPCMADAQEAMLDRTFLDPLEIPGYGTIEGRVTKGTSNEATYVDGQPTVFVKETIDLQFTFTNKVSGETRDFTLDYLDVKSMVECLEALKKIVRSPKSVNLKKNDIKTLTLTPPLKLNNKGVKRTYTTEYYTREYEDKYGFSSHIMKISLFTNAAKQTVWYFLFGKSDKTDEAKKWNVMQTSPDLIGGWLNKVLRVMNEKMGIYLLNE